MNNKSGSACTRSGLPISFRFVQSTSGGVWNICLSFSSAQTPFTSRASCSALPPPPSLPPFPPPLPFFLDFSLSFLFSSLFFFFGFGPRCFISSSSVIIHGLLSSQRLFIHLFTHLTSTRVCCLLHFQRFFERAISPASAVFPDGRDAPCSSAIQPFIRPRTIMTRFQLIGRLSVIGQAGRRRRQGGEFGNELLRVSNVSY